ncbi:integral membrane protein [Corynebacterium suranareeae]|uniref:Integral membrane protein n=1 Tax=Corynebacterium suranareeae TaxID=2506452 RepID=A0A160PLW1_9CORY|nr:hypothetical protein [Corynebacterium suranareeae]BAU94757.1 integral membrane protein [Corynebacterium suranareeae]
MNGIFLKILRSKRIFLALAGNGSVSVASFMLAMGVARASTIEEFGAFSLAIVAHLFASGLINDSLVSATLVKRPHESSYSENLKRSSLVGIMSGVVLIIWGFASSNFYILSLGVFIHGILLSKFQRTVNSASGNQIFAVSYTLLSSVPTVVVVLVSFFISIEPIVVFLVWAISGALSGYMLAIHEGLSIRPIWPKNREETRTNFVFGVDFLVGQGGALITTGLLGILDNSRILGAIRGSGTLLGPLNLISSTARPLVLPYLAREKENSSKQFRAAVSVTLFQVITVLPILVMIQFLPDWLGYQILGETWILASIVILPMSVDSIFSLIAGTAMSGHRVELAGKRILAIRTTTGILRPTLVLSSAAIWGPIGAAWGMAAIAIINTVVWWWSFYLLSSRSIEIK